MNIELHVVHPIKEKCKRRDSILLNNSIGSSLALSEDSAWSLIDSYCKKLDRVEFIHVEEQTLSKVNIESLKSTYLLHFLQAVKYLWVCIIDVRNSSIVKF